MKTSHHRGAPGRSPLRITTYNREIPWLGPSHSEDEWRSIEGMLSTYSPFGEIRTVLTSLRPGIGFDGYQGSATAMSLDHALQRMIGLPALPAGLDRDIYGGGKGLSLEDSVLSSLGEAIERMIGAFSSVASPAGATQRWASAAELAQAGCRYVGPDDIAIFAEEQLADADFLCEPWTQEQKLLWAGGTNLLTGDEVYVPSQLVHLFYMRQAGEARIGVSSSGGLATHLSEDLAVAHGILELIERDAANLSWYCRVPPRPIDFDRELSDPRITSWVESARRAGAETTFYAHETDCEGVTVVTGISVEPDLDEYGYLAGGGVGLTPEAAIRAAIAELVQSERMVRIPQLAPGWRMVQGLKRMFGISREARNEDFDNFIQVVPFYGYRENQRRLDWYLRDESVHHVRLSELPTHLGDLGPLEGALEVCRRSGLSPITYNLTPAGLGPVSLMKVFIPELVPAFPPSMQMLGHERYATFPSTVGARDGRMAFSELTTDPLPYP